MVGYQPYSGTMAERRNMKKVRQIRAEDRHVDGISASGHDFMHLPY